MRGVATVPCAYERVAEGGWRGGMCLNGPKTGWSVTLYTLFISFFFSALAFVCSTADLICTLFANGKRTGRCPCYDGTKRARRLNCHCDFQFAV